MNEYENRTIQQIVVFDFPDFSQEGSEAQENFRKFLAGISEIETLKKYAHDCLNNDGKKFPKDKNGLVLQDIVNTLAKRLGLKVEHGRYQRGYDGLWKTDEHAFVVEVKTTDAHTMKLTTIDGYRNKLLQEQKIKDNNSLLLVMGKSEGALEAQIRGLPRAWDTRIITVDSLIQLVELKVKKSSGFKSDDFYKILKPFDYTCVNGLVTLLAEIVSEAVEPEEDDIQETEEKTKSFQKPSDSHRKRILTKIEVMQEGNLVQNGRALFENSQTGELFFISFSKNHRDEKNAFYWHGYNPSKKCDFWALCTKDPNDWFYLIPTKIIDKLINEGKISTNKDKIGQIRIEIINGQPKMILTKGHDKEDIERYKVSLVS